MISVIIPYWDRQALLTGALEMYERLYPQIHLEIVVVDDGNAVPPDVSASPRARVVTLPRKDRPKNPCVPINAGAREARGEFLVLTNAEIRHRDEWVLPSLHSAALEDPAVYAACVVWQGHRKRWLAHPDHFCGHGPVPQNAILNHCAILHKGLFDHVGGFDRRYREHGGWDDNDFLFRLKRANARFVACREAVVEHQKTNVSWRGYGTNQRLFWSLWGHEPEVVEFARQHA